MKRPVVFVQIAVSPDGIVFALDNAGRLWRTFGADQWYEMDRPEIDDTPEPVSTPTQGTQRRSY